MFLASCSTERLLALNNLGRVVMGTIKSIMFGASALVLLGLQGPANAGTIIGGSSMLTSGYVTQLETWLGEGSLTLTNIFTKANGNTATDWHNSVDNQGRTFSVLEIVAYDPDQQQNVTQIIGGYNPQSWASSGSSSTPNDVDRTAFIFNLTTGVLQRQCLTTDPLICGADANDTGFLQTVNNSSLGPYFGAGADLRVDFDLNDGYSWNSSYDINGGQVGQGALNGIDPDPSTHEWVSVGALETFTISADTTPMPAPGMLAIFGLGLAGLGYARRKRAA